MSSLQQLATLIQRGRAGDVGGETDLGTIHHALSRRQSWWFKDLDLRRGATRRATKRRDKDGLEAVVVGDRCGEEF